jgi:hypothetical protein
LLGGKRAINLPTQFGEDPFLLKSLRRLWGSGGWLSNRQWTEAEAIKNALNRQGGERDHCPPVQSSEQPLGRFLGKSGVGLTALPPNLSHTLDTDISFALSLNLVFVKSNKPPMNMQEVQDA